VSASKRRAPSFPFIVTNSCSISLGPIVGDSTATLFLFKSLAFHHRLLVRPEFSISLKQMTDGDDWPPQALRVETAEVVNSGPPRIGVLRHRAGTRLCAEPVAGPMSKSCCSLASVQRRRKLRRIIAPVR
jgi:hypothetical protein